MHDAAIIILILLMALVGVPALLFLSLYLRDSGLSIFIMVVTYVIDYAKLKKLPVRKRNSDAIPINIFEKSLSSPYFILVTLNGIVIVLLSIYVYYQKGLNAAVFPILVSILVMGISFIIMPKTVQIYADGVAINDRLIEWTKIEQVTFSLPWKSMDASFVSQTVAIKLKEGVIEVFPMLYKDHKLLRNLLEEYFHKNGIQITVKERGI